MFVQVTTFVNEFPRILVFYKQPSFTAFWLFSIHYNKFWLFGNIHVIKKYKILGSFLSAILRLCLKYLFYLNCLYRSRLHHRINSV